MITADYETYSDIDIKKVGAAVYAAHPSTEVLSIAYDLANGQGVHIWIPGMSPPQALFNALANGTHIEAHNSGFEFLIWNLVCVPRHAWPWLYPKSVRCSQSKALANGLPAALDKMAVVLNTGAQKGSEGTRLIKKFSKPRKPTKANPSRRILPTDDPLDFNNMLAYNIQDVNTERENSAVIPDLSPSELEVWQTDQVINQRGVHIDREGVEACISIVEQAFSKYTQELQTLTGGAVNSVSEIQKFKKWLADNGSRLAKLDKDHVEAELKSTSVIPEARRALEIRTILGSASVKKLYAMQRYMMADDRIRYVLNWYEGHTGRWTSSGPQFHNFPKAQIDDVAGALRIIKQRDLGIVERLYGDPLNVVAACLRGLITPAPGADFICSDYKSIEAVVLAYLAGEQWRIDLYRRGGQTYETTAAMISGIPLKEILDHKVKTGKHHPLRASMGKIPDLSSGYQGAVGAWKKAGADKFYTTDDEGTIDEKIKRDVNKWRAANKNIVNFWYSIQNTAQDAIQYPGREFTRHGLKFHMDKGALLITLLSGRNLVYQEARISPTGKYGDEIIYKGMVKGHWVDIPTYGGKLTENIVQATARDILAHALVNLEKVGYPVVLHFHDEILSEVLAGTGSVEEVEYIMSSLPEWCRDWAVTAQGGWRGGRFRKD